MKNANRSADVLFGVSAIIAGLSITFWPDHSAYAGLLVFGLWATAAGVFLTAVSWRSGPQRFRLLAALAWFWTAIAGILALTLPQGGDTLDFTVGVWALGFGLLLGLAWLRERAAKHASQAGLVSILSLALGVALLVLPQNTVVSVGLLGAYFVVIAVWLIIGALSPRGSVDAEGITE